MYSNMQQACRTLGNGLYDFMPSLFTTTTSPGSTSRMYFASMRSSAQVSEASTYEPSSIPRQSGLNPCGSLTPIISLSVSMSREYEPCMRMSASTTLGIIAPDWDCAMRCTMSSLSMEVWKMEPYASSSSLTAR